MTSQKLSQLSTLADLQDGDKIYVVRESLPEDERSKAIPVEDARQYLAPGALPVVQRAQRRITTAELKALDTTYLEMIPDPGNGKYIEVRQIWMRKHGTDTPAVTYPRAYHVAISANDALDAAEAAAGNSATFTFVNVPTWVGGDRYIFIGVPTTQAEIIGINLPIAEEREDSFTRLFEATPVEVPVAGVPIKWWRTKLAYATAGDAFSGQSYITGWTAAPGPTLDVLIARTWLGFLFISDPTLALPLHSHGGEYDWVDGHLLSTVLHADGQHLFGQAVGGHPLPARSALMLGIGSAVARSLRASNYSEAVFDQYVDPLADTELGLTIRYEIHDTRATP